jgi:hypothetical protein
MVQGEAVEYLWLWIGGLILLLLTVLHDLSAVRPAAHYTAAEFERKWITDRNKEAGLAYRDGPGCYVILIYKHRRILPFDFGYESVYAGQSMTVLHRVHGHLNRKGNGDVYADLREGKWVEIDIYRCPPVKLNDLERKLIRRYHAEQYYNRTSGGGMKRRFSDRFH